MHRVQAQEQTYGRDNADEDFDVEFRNAVKKSLTELYLASAVYLLARDLDTLIQRPVQFALQTLEMIRTGEQDQLIYLAKFAIEDPKYRQPLLLVIRYAKNEIDQELLKYRCISTIDSEICRKTGGNVCFFDY